MSETYQPHKLDLYHRLYSSFYKLLAAGQKLNRRQATLILLLITALMFSVWVVVYATGGTRQPFPHLMYIPISIAAFIFYAPGGVAIGLLGGLLLGPFMPLDVSTGETQQLKGWLFRTGFFTINGLIIGSMSSVLNLRLQTISRLNDSMSTTYAHTLQTFADMVAVRDEQTGGHCERVAHNACALGRALGISYRELEALYWAGLLHDTGKIAVPENILLKPGRLTPEEYGVVKKHAALGAEMLNRVSSDFRVITQGVRSHHERWDGRGYPDGLAGEAIPLFGRILAVVDVFEALTSQRPYRKPLSPEEALSHLREGAGTHFDPKLVPIFERLLQNGKIYVHEDLGFTLEFKMPAQFRTQEFYN